MKITDYKENIISEILNLYIDSEGIILTGSFLGNSFSVKSDVDVIIISSAINLPYTEKIILNNTPYEFIFLPVSKIDEILKNDVLSLKGIFYNMFSSCEIIKNTNNVSSNIIEHSRYIHKNFYPFFDEQKIQGLKAKIHNYIDDLNSERIDYLKKFFLLNEITETFMLIHANIHADFVGFGKDRVSALFKNSPKIYLDIEKLLKDALEDSNKIKYFVDFIKTELLMKEDCFNYSQRSLPMDLKSSMIVKVEIPNEILQYNYKAIKSIDNSLNLIDFSFSNSKIELILFKTKEKQYLDLLKNLIKIFSIRNDNFSRIRIQHINLKKIEENNKIKLTKFVLKNSFYYEKENLILGIVLLDYTINNLIKSKQNEIILFLYHYWLSNYYDLDLKFDFFTLNEVKQKMNSSFDEKYINILHEYNKKEFNFDSFITDIFSLYENYQLVNNPFLEKYIVQEIGQTNQLYDVIKIESFISKIYSMIGLNEKKAFFAYFLNKLYGDKN